MRGKEGGDRGENELIKRGGESVAPPANEGRHLKTPLPLTFLPARVELPSFPGRSLKKEFSKGRKSLEGDWVWTNPMV